MTRFTMVAILLACAPACAGGQSGEEGARCETVATTPLAPGEASALGFGLDEVLATSGGAHDVTLTWAGGGSTPATLTVTHDGGEARFEERSWEDDRSGIEPAAPGDCDDVVAVDVGVTLVSEDGAFDESFEVAMEATDPTAASFWHDLDLGALGGTYTVTEVDPADYDEVRAHVWAAFDAGGPRGEVSGQASRVEGDPSDPDSPASATNFAIAAW